jgi:aspartate carbamoyltransferase catalytic subunit|tara:strand:- start:728 stop:958 length:231 start_codon:yes stop_codon:yes gene_type:complete
MNRHTVRRSQVREAARQANRQAEEERQAERDAVENETFTTTFTFEDGTTTTQTFDTAAEQARQEAFFAEGRSRGVW